ncbi:MAG: CDP-glycerol glycerophosphotransferase family protein [Patescibacteria group bacterium]
MKTIFITINRGLLARNVLRTNILKILKSREDLRIIIFVPQGVPEHFRKEFSDGEKVIIEELIPIRRTWFRKHIFTPLLKGMVLTNATRQLERFGTGTKRKNSILRYWAYLAFFWPLSRLVFFKKFFHYLEDKIYSDKEYEVYFEKYSPDLVLTTTVFSLADVAMNKIAKRKGVLSVGMAKSWDNLDKYLLQANPKKIIAQNEHLKNSAINYHMFEPEDIFLAGFPQFDIYADESVYFGREEFFKKMGIPADHKILFFGSEGPLSRDDEDIVDIIYNFMKNGELKYNCSLILRPHPMDSHLKRFEKFKNLPNIHIADYSIGDYFPDHWDPSREEMALFTNILRYSDVTINTFSTLSLDASCLDKPVINIAFDGYKIRPRGHSVLDVYKREHYKDVMEKKATRLAKSAGELKDLINMYLSDPSIDREQRAALRQSSCYFDGKAGQRVADYLLSEIYKNKESADL